MTTNKYKCGYCKKEFEASANYDGKISSKIQCPRCTNFLPTWEIVIDEYSGHHIHKGRLAA